MRKWLCALLVAVLCLCIPQNLSARETDGSGGLDDYTDLFLRENPDADVEEEDEGIQVLNELGEEKSTYSYIAVFIEFPDMKQFSLDSEESVNNAELFFNDTSNNTTISENGKTLPLVSFKSYIQKYSYHNMDVNSFILPRENGKVLSYVAPHPQSYYKEKSTLNPDGYDNTIFEDGKGNIVYSGGIKQQWAREFELLNGALEYVDAQISQLGLTGDDIDINYDGKVDAISFFCEAGDYEHYASTYYYNSLLWSHKLSGSTKYLHTVLGKKVSAYNLILGYDSNHNAPNGSFSLNTPSFGTVIHEFMHILGIPDMYRTAQQSTYPVGYYDVMAANNKVVSQPTLVINVSGDTYPIYWHDPLKTINKDCESIVLTKPKYKDSGEQNAIRIAIPDSSNQYIVAEYYDPPASNAVGKGDSAGVLLYRINLDNLAKGNQNGRSGQALDYMYIYRPNDSIKNQGNYTFLSQAVLNKTRNRYGTYLNGQSQFDSQSLYLADGSNSGIVVEVTDQEEESITLKITYSKPIESIALAKHSLHLLEGESASLDVSILPEDTNMDTTLSWQSTNPEVASVDENGVIQALSKGKTNIIVKSMNGLEDTCEVSVDEHPSIPIYRMYQEEKNIHAYVNSEAKKEEMIEDGWKYEKIAWHAPGKSIYPVYLAIHENSYFYTMSYKEYSDLDSEEWEKQGVAFYSEESETKPVFFLQRKDQYYYTSSFNEYMGLQEHGWTRKGIAWYASEN